MLRKIMIVLALAFAIDCSAPSPSGYARGDLGGRHLAVGRGGDHSGHVGRLSYRGLLQCYGCAYDPWGHWGSYYGPMIAIP
jgi:hypothetical protein